LDTATIPSIIASSELPNTTLSPTSTIISTINHRLFLNERGFHLFRHYNLRENV
jgi:hypothetical protein